jgi:hypothetical protein
MITDTEIKLEGYKALAGSLGLVQAEKFITLVMREPFDYTKWRRHLFADQSVGSLSAAAMKLRKAHR